MRMRLSLTITPGPLLDNTACGSTLGSACDSSIGKKGEDPVPASGIVALSLLAFSMRRRGQKRRAAAEAGLPGARS